MMRNNRLKPGFLAWATLEDDMLWPAMVTKVPKWLIPNAKRLSRMTDGDYNCLYLFGCHRHILNCGSEDILEYCPAFRFYENAHCFGFYRQQQFKSGLRMIRKYQIRKYKGMKMTSEKGTYPY